MEKFRQIKKLGVWEKFGENAEDSVSAAAQGGRVDELLAGTDLHLAPKPDFFKTEPPRRPLDPQTLSVEQATVAETLLDGADHLSIADKSISTFWNALSTIILLHCADFKIEFISISFKRIFIGTGIAPSFHIE